METLIKAFHKMALPDALQSIIRTEDDVRYGAFTSKWTVNLK